MQIANVRDRITLKPEGTLLCKENGQILKEAGLDLIKGGHRVFHLELYHLP